MKSFARALARTISEPALAMIARSAVGRSILQRSICQMQRHLGIGTGSDVSSSGELIVIDLLTKLPASAVPLCVFDVGANQGDFLRLLIPRLSRRPHQIHCFEPSPTTFALLRAAVGDVPDVIFNQFGLGSSAGEFSLFSDVAGSGLASLSRRRLDHAGVTLDREERVHVSTLDEYCDQKDVQKIDLLKLDVEGHEFDVLKGGKRMFEEGRVSSVSFEFGGCNIDTRTFLQDFYYFFTSHGMSQIFRILPSGGLQQISFYNEMFEQFQISNFLVLRDGNVAP